ncbi:MAG: protein kinase [Planctomycetes bacterium]|nr:protein kinase [Planctomycetota bacterium]
MDRDSEDLFLGKKALDRKLITPGQLREAMIEQARSAAPEGGEPPRLGDVFVSRNMLSKEQLSGLQEETKRIVRGTVPPRDSTLGRILVENRTITHSQLLECLRSQDEILRSGHTVEPRLGELLVQKGYATADEIRHALAVQEKTILSCSACGKRCNAASYDPARDYACPSCKAELRPLSSTPAEVSVQEQTQELDVHSDNPPKPGRILGKYTIVREIGRGGMGVVYEALDTTLSRRVALKMLVIQPKADPKAVRTDEERFLREAKLTAQLPPHPNVVGVYEAGILDGNRYIAMELIQGVSMLDWWKEKSNRLRQQVTVLRDTALGVQHAHQHGVIHRDLKPENLLIDGAGQPHITDFGLARELQQSPKDALTGKGMVVGSPHYMSPEAVRGLRVDRRADIYSLGVILYEAFTGKRPFDGGTPEEIMLKALKAEAPSPSSILRSQLDPALHRSLENICLKAIAKDPGDRYATAQAMADDLTRWLGGEEVVADLPRRRRLRIAGAGVAAALAVSVLSLVLFSRPSLAKELQAASQFAERGEFASARAAYDRVLARSPGHKEALSGKDELRRRQLAQRILDAEKLLEQGRPSEAFDAFMLVLIEDPMQKRAQEGKEEAKRRMVLSGGFDKTAEPKRP